MINVFEITRSAHNRPPALTKQSDRFAKHSKRRLSFIMSIKINVLLSFLQSISSTPHLFRIRIKFAITFFFIPFSLRFVCCGVWRWWQSTRAARTYLCCAQFQFCKSVQQHFYIVSGMCVCGAAAAAALVNEGIFFMSVIFHSQCHLVYRYQQSWTRYWIWEEKLLFFSLYAI